MKNIINILEFVVTSNFILIGVYLFNLRNSRNSGVKFLASFLILFGIHYLIISIENGNYCCHELIDFWFEYKLWSFFAFLFGPLIYIAASTYISGNLPNKKFLLINATGLAIPLFHLFKSDLIRDYSFSDWTYLGFLAECHNLLYAILSLFLLKRLNGEDHKNHKKLLVHVISGYFIFILIWVVFETVNYSTNTDSQLIRILFLLFLYYYVGRLTFLCIAYPDIINKSKYIRSRLKEWSTEKYQETKLSHGYAEKILLALEQYLEKDKNYTNGDLKLKIVSDYIGFPTKDISQVINVHLSKTFNEYVNEHRISAASRLLLEDNGMNISEVMYEVGFNSKSLFFKYFKEKHGMTPSQYKKQTQFNS